MRVEVDQIICDGSGVCVQSCPRLFRFQEGSKKAAALLPEVPAALEKACLAAAAACPTGAIRLSDVAGWGEWDRSPAR